MSQGRTCYGKDQVRKRKSRPSCGMSDLSRPENIARRRRYFAFAWTARVGRLRRPLVDERFRRRKLKSVRVRHRLAGDLAVADIQAVTQMDVVLQGLAPTLVGKLQCEG